MLYRASMYIVYMFKIYSCFSEPYLDLLMALLCTRERAIARKLLKSSFCIQLVEVRCLCELSFGIMANGIYIYIYVNGKWYPVQMQGLSELSLKQR